jgi:hypothetical protein
VSGVPIDGDGKAGRVPQAVAEERPTQIDEIVSRKHAQVIHGNRAGRKRKDRPKAVSVSEVNEF